MFLQDSSYWINFTFLFRFSLILFYMRATLISTVTHFSPKVAQGGWFLGGAVDGARMDDVVLAMSLPYGGHFIQQGDGE